jgi:hypothetical protein
MAIVGKKKGISFECCKAYISWLKNGEVLHMKKVLPIPYTSWKIG